jgi:hypothetical protein
MGGEALMPTRNLAVDVFDVAGFVGAVEKYRTQPSRHHSFLETTDLSGVPKATLSDVLGAKRPPTLATAIRLAVYADLDIRKFITVGPDDL